MEVRNYVGETYMIDNFTVIIEAETDLLDISKVQEEYENAMNSFDSYKFIRKPDFTQDLTEITILGNFNPVVWERYGVKSNIGSSNSFKFLINRYRLGLETCPQAKTSKSGHAISSFFFDASERRV